MSVAIVTKTITGANQWSSWVALKGDFNVSIWGTFVATLTLQRSFDGMATKLDVETFVSSEETIGFEPEGASYRLGVKAGAYTSGTAYVRLSQVIRV